MSPWIRLDDALGDDPRIASGGVVAAGVVALGLGYSNRNLTDGWIPAAVVERWLSERSSGEAATKHLGQLLQCQILKPEAQSGLEGYRIHSDYLSLQPTRAEVMKQRRDKNLQKAVAGRLGGQRSGEVRRKHAEAKAKHGEAKASALSEQAEPPIPIPIPEEKSTAAAAVPLDREASHRMVCKLFHQVWPNEQSRPDRVEAVKVLLAKEGMTASQNAIQKAEEVVARFNSGTAPQRARGEGWSHVAS